MLPLPAMAVGGGLTPAAGEVQPRCRGVGSEERPRFGLKWV